MGLHAKNKHSLFPPRSIFLLSAGRTQTVSLCPGNEGPSPWRGADPAVRLPLAAGPPGAAPRRRAVRPHPRRLRPLHGAAVGQPARHSARDFLTAEAPVLFFKQPFIPEPRIPLPYLLPWFDEGSPEGSARPACLPETGPSAPRFVKRTPALGRPNGSSSWAKTATPPSTSRALNLVPQSGGPVAGQSVWKTPGFECLRTLLFSVRMLLIGATT